MMCETVRCCDAMSSAFVAKVQRDVFAQFHTVAIKVTVVSGIDCLACQGEFFINDHLDVKL
jgi:hypothetical protein